MGDKYYLFYSWDCVTYYAVSDSINGPFVQAEDPLLASTGFSFYGEEEPVFVPSCKLGGAIETTDAGDTFCASVLNFVLENGIDGLTKEQRTAMLRFANTAAYIVTTRKGAIRSMPERAEVEALLAANEY